MALVADLSWKLADSVLDEAPVGPGSHLLPHRFIQGKSRATVHAGRHEELGQITTSTQIAGDLTLRYLILAKDGIFPGNDEFGRLFIKTFEE
ncbi:MAG: hypothetical protein Q7R30_14915 [Acidobacteriota bacterium]|nr:hypothetical protein [Acidobacteriota bacterium]